MRFFGTASYCSAIAVAVLWLAPFVEAAADEPDGAKPAPGAYEKIQAAEAERTARRKARNAARDGKIDARRAARGKPPLAPPGVRILWWNEPEIVEELGLSDEMRGQSDADFAATKIAEAGRTELAAAKKSYVDALNKGDWSAAEKQLALWVELVTRPIDSLGKLKLKVLPRLSDEQRQKLEAKFRGVVKNKWAPRSRWVKPRVAAEREPKPEK